MSEYVIRNRKHEYICIDPCGWPVFDSEFCNRTTRRYKEEMDEYKANLEKGNGFENEGLEVVSIDSINPPL